MGITCIHTHEIAKLCASWMLALKPTSKWVGIGICVMYNVYDTHSACLYGVYDTHSAFMFVVYVWTRLQVYGYI